MWMQELLDIYTGDIEVQQKLAELLLDPHADPDYQVEGGVLKFKGKLYVGTANDIRARLIRLLHDSAIRGHSGQRGCLHRI